MNRRERRAAAKANRRLGAKDQPQAGAEVRRVVAPHFFTDLPRPGPPSGCLPAATASATLCQLNYDPDQEPRSLFEAHLAWAETYAQPHYPTATEYANDPDAERPLRIGYLSGDLRRHPVALFVEPILRQHDRAGFEPFCYSNANERDDLNAHLRSLVPNWRDIVHLPDDRVAQMIRKDRIDILVDLSGHTARNRLLVFARKPAPVQVSALGYVNSSGLATMDYRLTDAWCDPPEQDNRLFTEELWRLPQGFNCYAPPRGLPEPGPLPFDERSFITFGSFNNLEKISPAVLDCWASILRAVPESRLILKTKTLSDPKVQRTILNHFETAGIAAERLELIEWSSTLIEHFDCYRRIDIGLDPFPYNGTTTTCEALMMGVPVIALAGQTHAARVSHSILSRLGLSVLSAPDVEGYRSCATTLVKRPEVIRNLRASLRQRMARSPLLDASGYTRGLEEAYRAMWQRWCLEQIRALVESPSAIRKPGESALTH